MAFAVARTRDEAHLYLELHPCPNCGSIDTPWEDGLADVEGELAMSYAGTCPGCDVERQYLFGLPARETRAAGWPTFGGPEPSALDLVAARERLHLTALGLLIPEVDRDKCAFAADRAGRRLRLTHGPTVHRGARSVVDERTAEERCARALTRARIYLRCRLTPRWTSGHNSTARTAETIGFTASRCSK